MLKLIELTYAFPGCDCPVFKGLNFELKPKEFCVVIGSNGSGKSTLLKLISGQYTPLRGAIWLEGDNVTKLDRSHLIACVVQDVNQGTIPDMTLLENMALSLMGSRRASLALYRRFEAQVVLQIKALGLGLEDAIYQPLNKLSGGQRQMVATLMAVHTRPKLLLLDEHTSALDPKMQAVLMNYTHQSIVDNQMTALMITHKLDDAIKYGNRLIMLHNGHIVLDVSGEEKAALNVTTLLNLFHHYEDLSLMDGRA
ncbi:MAG: ATP-binding cassette domain-containing protein [Gammaproteobacteria bacterium]|nr:ATP-binding cassette domain-containing protein [Gammaproteobacteria bacterium]